jgi:hypothetical protein
MTPSEARRWYALFGEELARTSDQRKQRVLLGAIEGVAILRRAADDRIVQATAFLGYPRSIVLAEDTAIDGRATTRTENGER